MRPEIIDRVNKLEQQKNFRAALALLDAHPDSEGLALSRAGRIFLVMGRFPDALRCFRAVFSSEAPSERKLAAIAPRLRSARLSLGPASLPNEAQEIFSSLTDLYKAAGQSRKDPAAKVILPLAPQPGLVALNIGKAFDDLGDAASADKWLAQAQSLRPHDTTIIGYIALRFARKGDPVSAAHLISPFLLQPNPAEPAQRITPLLDALARVVSEVPRFAYLADKIDGKDALSLSTRLRARNCPAWLPLAEKLVNSQTPHASEAARLLLRGPLPVALTGSQTDRLVRIALSAPLNDHSRNGLIRLWAEAHADKNGLADLLVSSFPEDTQRGSLWHSLGRSKTLSTAFRTKALERAIALAVDAPSKSKALWALAQLKLDLNLPHEATSLYSQAASMEGVPARFQAQAALLSLSHLPSDGDPSIGDSLLQKALSRISDPAERLDLARQLHVSQSPVSDKGKILFAANIDQAETNALQTMEPAKQLSRLLHTTQRRIDFADWRGVASFYYDRGGNAAADKLWSCSESYWEWICLIVRGVTEGKSLDDGFGLAQRWLQAPPTPDLGKSMLSTTLGLLFLDRKRVTNARRFFSDAITFAPKAEWTAHAYYWLAIDAYRRREDTRDFATHTLATIGPIKGYLWQQRYRMGASALLNLDSSPAALEIVSLDAAKLSV